MSHPEASKLLDVAAIADLIQRAAHDLPAAELPTLIAAMEGAKAVAFGRIVTPANTTPPGIEGELLTAAQMASRLNVPESWLRDNARAGRLPCVRLGHYMRFNPVEVTAALQGRADVLTARGRRKRTATTGVQNP